MRFSIWCVGFIEQVDRDPTYDENGERAQLPYERIAGDPVLGAEVYARECASCHGANGEGDTGTALSNQVMLIFASDLFLRHTIENGREETPMPSFKDKLSPEEIDGVTAFLRSKATGSRRNPAGRQRAAGAGRVYFEPRWG